MTRKKSSLGCTELVVYWFPLAPSGRTTLPSIHVSFSPSSLSNRNLLSAGRSVRRVHLQDITQLDADGWNRPSWFLDLLLVQQVTELCRLQQEHVQQ